MILAALDIATCSGLAVARGDKITATSFRPNVKRPFNLKPGEVDYAQEARIAAAFRGWLWAETALLLEEGVQAFAIERPIPPNLTIKKAVIDTNTAWAGNAVRYEEKGGTTFGTIFRLYSLHSQAISVLGGISADDTPCGKNIPFHYVSQDEWRKAFLGFSKAPKGTTNGSAYLKAQAKTQCERLGITVRNVDQADACGIVFWLRGFLNPRLARAGELFAAKAEESAIA